MRRVIIFFRRKGLYLGLVRYSLGLWMLPYAISKILGIQFMIDAATLQRPVGTLSGSQLTWVFLGHSLWFEVLLGFFELIPAILLFFRRTTLLGAILMLPITFNVLVINHAFQLWNSTKHVALVLFTLNCLIFLFKRSRIQSLLQIILQHPVANKYQILEWIINAIILASVSYCIIISLLNHTF